MQSGFVPCVAKAKIRMQKCKSQNTFVPFDAKAKVKMQKCKNQNTIVPFVAKAKIQTALLLPFTTSITRLYTTITI